MCNIYLRCLASDKFDVVYQDEIQLETKDIFAAIEKCCEIQCTKGGLTEFVGFENYFCIGK